MTKTELRKLSGAQRKRLSEEQVKVFSRRLLDHFALLDLTSVHIIHLFLPISEKKEPDTFLFIDWLSHYHPDIKIIVPKADFDSGMMINYVYKGRDGLVKSLYNILEPEQGVVYTGEVDLVLIPMLAFDLNGFRVGYGKGFYDRFLQNRATRKIGLCFFEPVGQIDDVNAHDISMDLCITPDKVYSFQG